jgi:5'-3' exonuclease
MLIQHFSKLKGPIETLQRKQLTSPLVSLNDSLVEHNRDKADSIHSIQGWSSVGFDIERIIDDFVFMCFFVGNDFLPCLPHMDIADGSLNLMMNVYRDMLPDLGGYLTDKSAIHLPRLELFVQEISRREPLYFQQRAVDDKDDGYATDRYKEHYYKVWNHLTL